MSKFRPLRDDEKYTHSKAINQIRADFKICQAGYEAGYLSKTQFKAAYAEFYNKERQYLIDNNLKFFFGVMYAEEQQVGTQFG